MPPFSRLPTHVTPIKYDLAYDDIDFVNFTFAGSVNILVNVNQAKSTSVTVHANELQIGTVSVLDAESGALLQQAQEVQYNEPEQTVTMLFENALPVGKCRVAIDFTGILNDKLAGLYRSNYVVNGDKRVMAVTQFEATDARRAFPCWDEPAIKASFQLSVTTPVDRVCISNTSCMNMMSVVRTSPSGEKYNMKLWKFQETPVMSTYLVALVVGEFDVISMFSDKGVVTSVYTPLGKSAQGQFALEVSSQALDFFDGVFGTQYPLRKSDLLAIPDFAAGAMENWGCVTYREAKILVDRNTTSQASMLGGARTVCHELAHQWFGNLVTMEWWSDLWLNEGFARFMEFLAVDHIFPQRDVWTLFIEEVQKIALTKDALLTSHPVYVEVGHPDEVNEIFDGISYAKGASLINMLQHYVGIDGFMSGVRAYVVKHKYSNAKTKDLWAAIEEANGLKAGKISSLMDAWLTQMGYPVVSVREENGSLRVSQERYLATHATIPDELASSWPVPVRVAWYDEQDKLQTKSLLLHEGHAGDESKELNKLMSDLKARGQIGVLNYGMGGFFRTNYQEGHYEILHQLMQKELASFSGDGEVIMGTRNRLGLVRDAFACAKSGRTSLVVPLRLVVLMLFGSLEAFKNGTDATAGWVETNATVLKEMITNLLSLGSLFKGESFNASYVRFVTRACAKLYERLGWGDDAKEDNVYPGVQGIKSSDEANEAALRVLVLKAASMTAAGAKDDEPSTSKAISSEAVARFAKHCEGEQKVSAELRNLVFKIAAKKGGKATLDSLMAMFKDEDLLPDERRDVLYAIGSVSDDDLVGSVVNFVVKSGEVRSQDIGIALSMVCSSPKGANLMWEDIKTNWDWWYNKFGTGGNFLWASIMRVIIGGLTTMEQVDEVKSFFESHPKGSAARAVDEALESVVMKTNQVERARGVLPSFLEGIFA